MFSPFDPFAQLVLYPETKAIVFQLEVTKPVEQGGTAFQNGTDYYDKEGCGTTLTTP